MPNPVLTNHQILQPFLDFLTPFGNQQYAQHFHFRGSKYDDKSQDVNNAWVPILLRPGIH